MWQAQEASNVQMQTHTQTTGDQSMLEQTPCWRCLQSSCCCCRPMSLRSTPLSTGTTSPAPTPQTVRPLVETMLRRAKIASPWQLIYSGVLRQHHRAIWRHILRRFRNRVHVMSPWISADKNSPPCPCADRPSARTPAVELAKGKTGFSCRRTTLAGSRAGMRAGTAWSRLGLKGRQKLPAY